MVEEKTFEDILNGLKDNSLINEGKLDLTKFNNSVNNASTNLGKIIPSIINVSKEQVAVINHGLENVIAFTRVFQTVNTSFAIMAQIGKVDNDLENMGNFEDYLVNDILKTLEGLDTMLDATFKEIDVYYGALAKIISSKDEKNYNIKFSRKKLPKNLESIFEGVSAVRTGEINKNIEFKGGLGIFQIIDNLTQLKKEVEKVKLNDEEIIKTYIKTSNNKKIEIDIDILQALKSLSVNLIHSLQKVGKLTQDESDSTKNIEIILNKEKGLVSQGISNIKKFKDLINERKNIINYFKEICKKTEIVENINTLNSEQEFNRFKKEQELNKSKNNLMKKHDLIIKRQMEIIHNVINLFSTIVSVWGWQVDEEVHIGQVADKTIIALKQLSKLQKDKDLDNQPLLIAESTQKSISNTCKEAEELTSVSKVMQMLLKRVKRTLQMNSIIENELKQMDLTKEKYEEYKNERIKKVIGLLAKRFPLIEKEAKKNIEKFSKELNKLSNKDNIRQNNNLINNIKIRYGTIEENVNNLIKDLKENINDLTPQNFNEKNKLLTSDMGSIDGHIDNFVSHIGSTKQALNDDFNSFMNIADSYKRFINVLAPMLDLLKYTINLNKELTRKRIGMRGLNIKLRMFQNFYDKLRKNQIEENKQDKDVIKVLKEVGMDRSIFKDYIKRFEKTYGVLYNKLKEFTSFYFKEAELTDKAYNLLDKELSQFNVDFNRYNNELKDSQVGFFQKLFNTQSYKKSKFWNELKEVTKELTLIDKTFQKIKKARINKDSTVKSFCSNSVVLINDMLNKYKEVMVSINGTIVTMLNVTENINNLIDEGYLKTFKSMIEKFKDLNNQTKKIEDTTKDLPEIVQYPVNVLEESFNKIPEFLLLINSLKNQKNDLNSLTIKIKDNSDSVKKLFLKYYAVYLYQIFNGNRLELDKKVLDVLTKNEIIEIVNNKFKVIGYK